MDKPTKEQIYGAVGTVLFHIVIAVILLLVVMNRPIQQEEAGVPVLMGNTVASAGDAYRYTEVAPAPAQPTMPANPVQNNDEPLITQDDEPSAQLPSADKSNKEKKGEKKTEPSEAELKAQEAERERLETERIAREAAAKMAAAFGKGSTMNDSGKSEEGKGNEGSPQGNETVGAAVGAGGYGNFDLGGRNLAQRELPRPEYNVQDEGRVVVTITVNPEGSVIKTSINPRTNTTNSALRQAALKAASQAVFEKVDELTTQTGTITYYFKLK